MVAELTGASVWSTMSSSGRSISSFTQSSAAATSSSSALSNFGFDAVDLSAVGSSMSWA